jgi:hypothetical protein
LALSGRDGKPVGIDLLTIYANDSHTESECQQKSFVPTNKNAGWILIQLKKEGERHFIGIHPARR